jgi:hypothetical protein
MPSSPAESILQQQSGWQLALGRCVFQIQDADTVSASKQAQAKSIFPQQFY